MFIFFAILIMIAAVLLTLVVVVQNSKGGGLAAGFDSSNRYMGVRKTTDFLEKATWWLVGAVACLSILSTPFIKKFGSADSVINQKELQQKSIEKETPMPIPTIGAEEVPAAIQPQPVEEDGVNNAE